jgi:hypothetical protein
MMPRPSSAGVGGNVWAWLVAGPAAASITELEVKVDHIDTNPQILVSVTGDPCPEEELTVRLDGKVLEAARSPTTCETQQKLRKTWWRLVFSGPPPAPGEHEVEVEVAGGDPVRGTFTLGARPSVKLPAKITHDPVTIRSDGVQVRGQLAMRPKAEADCSAVFKAPLRGSGPEYPVSFVPKVCNGRSEVSARLTSDLAVACDAGVACSGSVVWSWSLGEAAFDLRTAAAAP